jgi:hypothetical protein
MANRDGAIEATTIGHIGAAGTDTARGGPKSPRRRSLQGDVNADRRDDLRQRVRRSGRANDLGITAPAATHPLVPPDRPRAADVPAPHVDGPGRRALVRVTAATREATEKLIAHRIQCPAERRPSRVAARYWAVRSCSAVSTSSPTISGPSSASPRSRSPRPTSWRRSAKPNAERRLRGSGFPRTSMSRCAHQVPQRAARAGRRCFVSAFCLGDRDPGRTADLALLAPASRRGFSQLAPLAVALMGERARCRQRGWLPRWTIYTSLATTAAPAARKL